MRKSRQDSLYSQQYIREALDHLLEENDLEDITITDICKKAGVARVTFYKYYHTIYDVMSASVEVYVKSAIEQLSNINPQENIQDMLTDMIAGLAESPMSLKRQINSNTHGMVLDYFIYAIDRLSQADTVFSKKLTQAEVLFIAGGIFSIITYWFKNDLHEPPESIAAMITDVLPSAAIK
ncbi:DNA-binding transcriptional regulator, AcrR family [Terribacillus halophilus]|uniref:DNA-binding transcriptional regulator, AcrR family n=1 Tax=Terribacillus halophilus TaxID=361279 RepID=A0A1G6W6Y8_9BACI|nr:TetR/AcrR family transcriptional regulator [Terribacillus halophilus]SDD60977.1 DNA-binding transcriptional regulator, AcrR family [Terribacillus halophilus]